MAAVNHLPVLSKAGHDVVHLAMAEPEGGCSELVKDAHVDGLVVAFVRAQGGHLFVTNHGWKELVPDNLQKAKNDNKPKTLQCVV